MKLRIQLKILCFTDIGLMLKTNYKLKSVSIMSIYNYIIKLCKNVGIITS